MPKVVTSDEVMVEGPVEEYQDGQDFDPMTTLPKEVQDAIPGWKQRFEDVFSTSIGEKTYVWRPLSWGEYKDIQRSMIKLFPSDPGESPTDMELKSQDRRFANMEQVLGTCMLYPAVNISNVGKLGSGAIHTLYENIAAESGFEPEYVQKL
jgi:hypothetical protein